MLVHTTRLTACEQAATDAGLVGVLPSSPSCELLVVYYHAVMVTYPCLLDNDFTVTTAPSEEWCIDNGGAWDPYADLPVQQYSAAEDVCPRNTVDILEQIVASGQTTTP